MIPIASQQTITVMDNLGDFAVIECNCNYVEAIKPTERDSFVVATNGFVSPKMIEYNNYDIDDWRSEERYSVAYNSLRESQIPRCKQRGIKRDTLQSSGVFDPKPQ